MSKTTFNDDTILEWGRETLRSESLALSEAAARLSTPFAKAARAILEAKGKVVVTGLGKSGHVARKVASTFSSTGTVAMYLHPTEAQHGDFGVLTAEDCLLAIAFGGETDEVNQVAKFARRLGATVVSVTGKPNSTLAQLSHHVLDGSVQSEACALNLAPTSSSTVALAIGDALAVALMRARGFQSEDFAKLHPGGVIGRRLALVEEHMHTLKAGLPTVRGSENFHAVLERITNPNFGIVAVVDEQKNLLGAISDGDVRRALIKFGGASLNKSAIDLMSENPKSIGPHALAADAFKKMEENKITSLFVVESGSQPRLVGLVRIHDLLAAKIV